MPTLSLTRLALAGAAPARLRPDLRRDHRRHRRHRLDDRRHERARPVDRRDDRPHHHRPHHHRAPPPGTTLVSTGTTDHEATSTTGSPGPGCGEGWCTAKDLLNVLIQDNYDSPHELVIPAVDVAACEARTYEFTGLAVHTHTVTLTPEHIATIDQGGSVEIESSEAQGHIHTVWSDCG